MQCSVDWVNINLTYSPPATRVACHELGHAMGLRHNLDTSSCVMSSADGGTSQYLSTHDKDHLTNNY
jgi:predicted Zn-dependent protease